jgi:hypothetical protein
MITAFAVGVPARDEVERIESALRSLGLAARSSPVPVHLAVTADSCADRTHDSAVAALHRCTSFATKQVRSIESGSAGAARNDACEAALASALSSGCDPRDVWIATTDADTTVPEDWFVSHHAWARRGAHGVAGLIQLAADDGLCQVAYERWRQLVERRGTGDGHRHVHGANLGIRADYWLAAGGFDHRAVGEDHELWRRARRLGASLHGVSDIVVTTSARTVGRAPGGLARVLANLSAIVATTD